MLLIVIKQIRINERVNCLVKISISNLVQLENGVLRDDDRVIFSYSTEINDD